MHTRLEHIADILGQYIDVFFDVIVLPLHTEAGNRCHRIEEKVRPKLQPNTPQFRILHIHLVFVSRKLQINIFTHHAVKSITQKQKFATTVVCLNLESFRFFIHLA